MGARRTQATAAQARLAGGRPRGIHAGHPPRDRTRRRRLGAARVPRARDFELSRQRLWRGCAALRRRQDTGGRWGDGQGEDQHAHPGDQHGLSASVAQRTTQANDADRGRNRRVLGTRERGQAGHDRDLPNSHRKASRSIRTPRPARRPRLGPHYLRRGASATGAGLQVDGRASGQAAARPHRNPRSRRRTRGRRVQPDRTKALRCPMERDRGPRLHLAGQLLRGARRPTAAGTPRVRRSRRRPALPARRDGGSEGRRRPRTRGSARGRAHPRDRPIPRPNRRAWRDARCTDPDRRDTGSRAGTAV